VESDEVQLIVHRAALAWITGSAEAFADLFAPDGEFIVPGKVYRGRAAIREVAADFAARHSAVKIMIKRIIVEGDQAVVEWQWRDTQSGTGRRQQADDAIVIDFKDGEISRWREYIDAKSVT
jgi:uncharacterized protein (TIGR02246 family)